MAQLFTYNGTVDYFLLEIVLHGFSLFGSELYQLFVLKVSHCLVHVFHLSLFSTSDIHWNDLRAHL